MSGNTQDPGGPDEFDVIIVGAGISGIAAAYHLKTQCPELRFCILEARAAIGGTWDLFRYPGVRADSDISTLSFPFRPWQDDRSIVDGDSLRTYIEATADALELRDSIRLGHRVIRASWHTKDTRWTLDIAGGANTSLTCRFLIMCSGYYDYAWGYQPHFPGMEDFRGRLVHPQHWPSDLDHSGSRIVVIGSGATAVSLAPALAATAAQVTLLQRTPSYIVSRPSRDPLSVFLHRHFAPEGAAFLLRWRDVVVGAITYALAKRRPALVRRLILGAVRRELGPGFDTDRHFSPPYPPWDQRVCLIPDGDLFKAMKAGAIQIETGAIERFTETGIRLESGREIGADIVVSATGLVVKLFGGAEIVVDGQVINPARHVVYKGLMLDGVPNLAFAFGYINASWTLRADLAARAVCRLLRLMGRRGFASCVPVLPTAGTKRAPLLDFSSGYVARAREFLPSQGGKSPWRVHQNYFLDRMMMLLSPIQDGVLRFTRQGTELDGQDLGRGK